MLRDRGYNDPEATDLLMVGLQVVGCLEEPSIWPAADKSPQCLVSEAEVYSKVAQRRFREYMARGSVIQEVWRQTMEEVTTGLLDGPCSDEHLAKNIRWFGLQQGLRLDPSTTSPSFM